MYNLFRKSSAVRDIDKYLDTMRAMRDRDLADTLSIALQIRKSLLGLGKGDLMLPWEAVSRNPNLPIELEQAIKHWHTQGDLFSMSRASGAVVWLHSLRAVAYPEIRARARELWGELARGFPHLSDGATFPRGLHPTLHSENDLQLEHVRPLPGILARVRGQQPLTWIAAFDGASCTK